MKRAELDTVGPIERALLLRARPLFGGMRAHDLALLAQLMREETQPVGAVVQQEGQRVRAVRLLTNGTARLRRRGHDIGRVEAPEAVGLLELLAGRAATTTVIAGTPLTSLIIDDSAWLDMLEDDIALVVHLRTALGRLLAAREAEQQRRAPDEPTEDFDEAPPPPDSISFVDRLLWLQRAPRLRRFGVAVLAALLRDACDIALAPGAALFEAGSQPQQLYVVTHGALRGAFVGAAAPFRAAAGAVLGENAALADIPHAYTAIAETPVLGIGISAQAFWDIAEDHFHVAREALAGCAQRLLRLDAAPEVGATPDRRGVQPASHAA